jgi:hypothetical protein
LQFNHELDTSNRLILKILKGFGSIEQLIRTRARPHSHLQLAKLNFFLDVAVNLGETYLQIAIAQLCKNFCKDSNIGVTAIACAPLITKKLLLMSMETLEFIIHPDGRVQEQVTGIVGSSCTKVTAEIEAALGQVVAQAPTADFFNPEVSVSISSSNLAAW